jgi:nitrogen regulatory protein P-II 1
MTVTEVKGFGTQRGVIEEWQGQEFWIEFLPKIWFLVVVDDAHAEQVIDAICEAAATGEVGDGKIFVSDVADAIRVRTRERGAAALTGGVPVTPK